MKEYCPIGAIDCSYYDEEQDGVCCLASPMEECDDYYAYYGDEEN